VLYKIIFSNKLGFILETRHFLYNVNIKNDHKSIISSFVNTTVPIVNDYNVREHVNLHVAHHSPLERILSWYKKQQGFYFHQKRTFICKLMLVSWVLLKQWKIINRKQCARWQHLSRLKASETQQLILEIGNAIKWVIEPYLFMTMGYCLNLQVLI